MSRALAQAQAAFAAQEVPVGAILVAPDGKTILAEAANAPIANHDPTAHAEIRVLQQAAKCLGNYRLTDCTLYVTLEPCTMCAGAISHARIGHLVYGASDKKGGAVEHGVQFFASPNCHHRPKVTGGIQSQAAAKLLTDFFQNRRKK
ncbi:tRNA-specific adenosine-34 deaminase [hydrothermal vent metagenome]|uniref:tRNA-specific adenosine deaminase 2 n=1 Tax=hydrothermal vent metagenome TaxID=652676 RepID=A0A3B0RGS4_9ZZZZ